MTTERTGTTPPGDLSDHSAHPTAPDVGRSASHSSSRRSAPHSSIAGAAPEPGSDASREELEADLERTRRELGETLGALTDRLDVKAQAREQIDMTKERVAEQAEEARARALGYVDQAKGFVTDERGKPNQNGWIAVAAGAIAVSALVFYLARR